MFLVKKEKFCWLISAAFKNLLAQLSGLTAFKHFELLDDHPSSGDDLAPGLCKLYGSLEHQYVND
jgi:hypothetical protein